MKTDRHGNECSHEARITIRSIALPEFDYAMAKRNAEQLYGSNGIYFNVVSEQCTALSEEMALRLAVIDGTCRWNQFSEEQDDLYDAVGGSMFSGILVCFVGSLMKPDGGRLNGCAGHEPAKPTAVIGKSATVWTMAHEVGHILLSPSYSPVHTASSGNIMYRRSSTFTAASSPSFDAAQVTQMKSSRYVRPC